MLSFFQEVLRVADAEMQAEACKAFLQVLQNKLVPLQHYSHTFLQTILLAIDSKDPGMLYYVESNIQTTFKKKYFKSETNTFPINAWYDDECKSARKTANEYAKTHDLNVEAQNQTYKSLYKQYKYVIQRKKRLHQKSNRDELDRLQTSSQTERWKL